MDKREIQLQKGQYLSEVYPLIESNIILNKRLSGVGATHCEIIAPRNSIIVVPNTPIIDCKVSKHRHSDNLFGVMSLVTVRDIIQYLSKTVTARKTIKIMVTPESFYKVRQAFEELNLNMYDLCFLMLDECHKFITERDFRKDITLPFNSFFKFKNKAMVSATPIIPSDPRFAKHNFRLVEVKPQDFKRFEILIIRTNDLRQAFKAEYSWMNIKKGRVPKSPQCIFVNSADIIADLIEQSNLHEISSIFCSPNSASRLKGRGFSNVHTEWKEEYQNIFMFFTSRFYTGLDIYLPTKPRVIYMSDAINAQNTLMDPYTDMAQACGRFRNGMDNIFHYVVFNSGIEYKTETDIVDYLNGIQKSFHALYEIYENSQSESEKKLSSHPFNHSHIMRYSLMGRLIIFSKTI
ncbi:MAG: DEAD/DEAH box helicase family protein [Muribaculaceae bacterium]|nr:DEAD/DEAH box helicase family protein [Muribaculaceae bacterium]